MTIKPWQRAAVNIEYVADRMQEEADRNGKPIDHVFNKVSIVAFPGLPSTEIVAAYWNEQARRKELLRRSRETGLYTEDET